MIGNLVISADSVIGLAICNALGAVGTTRREPPDGRLPFDLRNQIELPLARFTYFCSGINGFKKCEASPKAARYVNVECTLQHALEASYHGWVVLLSSCAAETHPDTVYGRLKLETEHGFLALGKRASIFRFGPVMFPGRKTYPNKEYHPIELEKLVSILTTKFEPGLHRILNTPVTV